MTTSSKTPIYLFQVLEEEYAALHGDSARTSKRIKLPDLDKGGFRTVLPTYDWTFRKSHIRNVDAFIDELSFTSTKQIEVQAQTSTLGRWVRFRERLSGFGKRLKSAFVGTSQPPAVVDPDKLAKDKLIAYLRSQLAKRSTGELCNGKSIAKALNMFLTDPVLFAEDRFSNYWLNTATRGMRDIHTSVGPFFATGPLTGDELVHFNRLLLEDAFPSYLEKIHRIRLAAVYQHIHEKRQTALCFSGGGIRSGTFALGLLQGLARHNLLDKFHYLSTVSGGGYIGSWLAAWIHRHPLGLAGVTADLANKTPRTKVDPDPEPIRYLRRYSNFITPKVGLLSADTWTFIGIYLRNLLLNWIVFIPLLLAVLMLPRLVLAITIAPEEHFSAWHFIPVITWDNFVVPGRYVFLTIGFLFTAWAIAYIMFNRPTVREELRQASNYWRRKATQRHFQSWCLLPLSIAAFTLTTYWAWSSQHSALPKRWSAFVIFGVAATLLAWVISSWVLGRIRSIRGVLSLLPNRIFSRDLVYLLVAGSVGGFLLWAATRYFDPFAAGTTRECASLGAGWTWKTWYPEVYACLAAPGFCWCSC